MAFIKLHRPRGRTVPSLVGQCLVYPPRACLPVKSVVAGQEPPTACLNVHRQDTNTGPRDVCAALSAMRRALTFRLLDQVEGSWRLGQRARVLAVWGRAGTESRMRAAPPLRCAGIRGLGCLLVKRRRPPRGAGSEVPVLEGAATVGGRRDPGVHGCLEGRAPE